MVAFSTRSRWSRQTNVRWSLRIRAPGSRCDSHSTWTSAGAPGTSLTIPVTPGAGRYVHPDPVALAAAGQVVFRYAPGHNPNGSLADIAGVRNPAGNVVGPMPHPEHAVDPLLGPVGGRGLFESVLGARV